MDSISRIKEQRLTHLEGLLEIQYEKLSDFQKKLSITASEAERFDLEQRIKSEILPSIRKYEVEYAELLAEEANKVSIPENDAQKVLLQVTQAVERIEHMYAGNLSDELRNLLMDIREKLDDPGKIAAAKLKVVLPIIPLLVSYELEIDTESFIVKVLRGVKSLFRGEA